MQAPDFDPIDAQEAKVLGFDFAPLLQTGDTVASVVGVTCSVHSGVDANPSSRMISGPTIVPSASSTLAGQGVAQKFGTMIAGNSYVLSCLVNTTLGEVLEIWARIVCRSPN